MKAKTIKAKKANKLESENGYSVFDMYTGEVIKYPNKDTRLKYDFHFKNGYDLWIYINSSDNIDAFEAEGQFEAAKYGWRIVEAGTGIVVKDSNQNT